jgi:hypothetical protein
LEEVVTLIELAERCEKAEGPDRELDALIRCALFAPAGAYVEQSAINGAWVVYSGGESRSGRPRLFEHWPSQEARNGAFTASIDAALTLVPEYETEDGLQRADYILEHVNGGLTIGARVGHDDPDRASWGATDALAICAAALRARAS